MFSLGCEGAIEERNDYPSLHVWIDVDGDGACDPESDLTIDTVYFGFGSGGIHWFVTPTSDMAHPVDSCALFEALVEDNGL